MVPQPLDPLDRGGSRPETGPGGAGSRSPWPRCRKRRERSAGRWAGGIGGAGSYNTIASTVRAYVADVTIDITAGSLRVSADASAGIFALSAGVAGALAGLAGSPPAQCVVPMRY